MKKSSSMLLAVAVLTLLAPVAVSAESIDTKIQEQDRKINSLSSEKADAEKAIAETEASIKKLETQVADLLKKKVDTEKEVSELNDEIVALTLAIEKRMEKIEDQARSTQINQTSSSIMTAILDAESITDAVTRSITYTKLVTANNEIANAQKADQESLKEKKAEVDKKLVEINKTTESLKTKTESLESAKFEQEIQKNQLAASLETETGKKEQFVKQKEEAERLKAEQERLAKEQAEKLAKLAKEQADQAAAEAAKAAKAAEEASKQPDVPTSNGGDAGSGSNGNSGGGIVTPPPVTLPPSSSGFQLPVTSYTLTSGFGSREDPTGSSGNSHMGIDMANVSGTPIMASRGGVVVASGYEPGAGEHVIIQHDNGYYTYYMHLSVRTASVGQNLSAGQVLGLMGTTGNSTGVHLHFGISTGLWSGYVNPAPFLGI